MSPITRFSIRKDYKKITIQPSRRHGYGVFTARDIERGEAILPFDGTRLTQEEFAAKWSNKESGFALQMTKENYYIDPTHDLWALGRFVNASDCPGKEARPNVKCKEAYRPSSRRIRGTWFIATRKIRARTELLFPYGSRYWNVREKTSLPRRNPCDKIYKDHKVYALSPACSDTQFGILTILTNESLTLQELLADPNLRVFLRAALCGAGASVEEYYRDRGLYLKQQLTMLERKNLICLHFRTQKYLKLAEFPNFVWRYIRETYCSGRIGMEQLIESLRGPERCSHYPSVSCMLQKDPRSLADIIIVTATIGTDDYYPDAGRS